MNTRRLDIGIASYGNTEKLKATMDSIAKHSVTNWRCFVIDNPGPDPNTRQMIQEYCERDKRFQAVFLTENIGYAGAVNELICRLVYGGARTNSGDIVPGAYVAYCDNDIEISTPGWDEIMCKILDDNPECAQVFPGKGHYGFFNGRYHECLWSAGFCWVLRPNLSRDVRYLTIMDDTLGHHEEVDVCVGTGAKRGN